MDGEPFAPRIECPRCRRPARECYCAAIVPQRTRTKVVILQHPRERDVAIGTARMASLCLPDAELHVGASFEGSALLERIVADSERPAALLWPGEGAIDVLRSPPERPITLVVVDGTWPHAKKLVKTTPTLAALPRYAFVAPRPSEYRIRREPHEAYLSTIESLCVVLGALEGEPERFTSLLAPFRAMVEAQLGHARTIHTPRRRHKPVRTPRPRAPSVLHTRARDLVVVSGEANAWPLSSPEHAREPAELVHWLACRMATGEVFERLVAPSRPLSPTTAHHARLSEEAIRRGIARDAFPEQWRTFVKDDDVLLAWGDYPFSLLAGAGAHVPPDRIDLRHLATVIENRRVGALESYHASFAARPDAPRPGRGGLRLAMSLDVARHLATVVR
ncbi:MAG: tRNA-uridine aminocarboxypropyltransferase [Sandaracinus sp.]